MKTIKYLALLAAAAAVILLVFWAATGGWDAVKGYFNGAERGVKTTVPPPPEEVGVPATAEPVPMTEDRKTFTERLSFWTGDSTAEELTAGLRPGTEVYVVTEPGAGGQTVLYRTEEGYVYKEGEGAVEAYRAPEPAVAAEFRPKIMGTTDFSTVGIAAELDMVRLWDVHLGPAGGYASDKTGWAGAGGAYNLAKNFDVGAYAGKTIGGDGWSYGMSVGLAVE